jgi:hypothetical protein
MSKILTFSAALAGLFCLSLVGPAGAAERKADGIQNQQLDQYEVSDQRRYRRYRYYRPYPYYGYRPYPYYGYGYPYAYRPYPYYGSPGIGFSFRF